MENPPKNPLELSTNFDSTGSGNLSDGTDSARAPYRYKAKAYFLTR